MINNKHKIFADNYIKTGDSTKAYQLAYPKAQKESARVKSSKLLQNDTVLTYLNEMKHKINSVAEIKLINELSNKETVVLLTATKKREILANIANGELIAEKTLVVNGQLEKVFSKPNHSDIMKAIELDNKITGEYSPTKIALTDSNGNDKKLNNELLLIIANKLNNK